MASPHTLAFRRVQATAASLTHSSLQQEGVMFSGLGGPGFQASHLIPHAQGQDLMGEGV